MRPLGLVICVLLVAIVVPGGAAAKPSGGGFTSCSDDLSHAGWYDLQARNVACRVAAKVANHFILVAHAEDDGYKGWACANTQRADDPIQNACKRRKHGRKQKLKFQFAG